jgi:hypothetical protein
MAPTELYALNFCINTNPHEFENGSTKANQENEDLLWTKRSRLCCLCYLLLRNLAVFGFCFLILISCFRPTRPDREPLRCPDYRVLRLVRPLVQARQSAVRQDAARPALVSVPGVRSLVSRRRRTCNRCLPHNPGNNRFRHRVCILLQASRS